MSFIIKFLTIVGFLFFTSCEDEAVGTPPGASNVTSVDYTSTVMTVQWEQSTDEDFQDYKVFYATSEDGESDLIATYTDISTTSHSITEFDPFVENWFFVRVTNTAGLFRWGTGMTNTVYDCEEAETEIVSLQEDFDENPVMATCNLFKDKVDEYVALGCGDADDAGMNCSEWVCTLQGADLSGNRYIMRGLSFNWFPFDSLNFNSEEEQYCTYYDSVAINMQNMVDAGGCDEFIVDSTGYSFTQADVDEWVSNGCDWVSNTTSSIGGSFFPFEKVSEEEMIDMIENKVSKLPEEYGTRIMRKIKKNLKYNSM